ncbi:hypothetical protein [Micromonospora coerulea]|uniref:hypothetical protein n=1 Tax=Micromonospora coerulea TaxID=47856 RepID=UPI0019044D37|nr:hypothetical protein [Micromonospora veneta]
MFVKIARHLAGAAVACLVFVVQGAVVYLGLLAYAIMANADTGGPLAGPVLVLLAGVVGVALVPLLFLPASVVGEVAAKSGRLLAKLLVASAVAAVLSMIYVFLVAVATDVPIVKSVLASLLGVLAVLGPTAACVGVSHGVRKIRPNRQAREAADGMAKVG